MRSLANGYMERRNVSEVDYHCSWEYPKPIQMIILMCPNERKQS